MINKKKLLSSSFFSHVKIVNQYATFIFNIFTCSNNCLKIVDTSRFMMSINRKKYDNQIAKTVFLLNFPSRPISEQNWDLLRLDSKQWKDSYWFFLLTSYCFFFTACRWFFFAILTVTLIIRRFILVYKFLAEIIENRTIIFLIGINLSWLCESSQRYPQNRIDIEDWMVICKL